MSPATDEPPFDPSWLEVIAGSLAAARSARAVPSELYLERRLEVEVRATHHAPVIRECRTEGAAIRWSLQGRSVLHARNGVSPLALGELLEPFADLVELPQARPAPAVEIDAPRGWTDWARTLVERLGAGATAGFLARRAAVVGRGSWSMITTPPLLRVHVDGDSPASLLAVWPHPCLATWLQRLTEPRPARRWRPSSGLKVPVLFTEGTAGVLLHELVGHLVEADLASAGASPLATLGGATITAQSLTVVDDPTRFDLPGAFSCDDEGIEAEPIQLVEGGRLQGWICDLAGAERLGARPGRGRRCSFSEQPLPRVSNLVVTPGNDSVEDIIREIASGLMVTRISSATVDPISARALIRVERGWEIRNGRRRRALAGCELTGPVVEILATIDPALGNDPEPDWRLGWCMKASMPLPTGSEAPSLLTRGLEVL